MNHRGIPAHFTAEQRAFLEAVTGTRAHLYLRATAGAGKTTTLSEAAWQLGEDGSYFAYNKHNVTDLQPRLPTCVRAATLHAHGYRLQRDASPNLELRDDKGLAIARHLLPRDRRGQYALTRAWNAAREAALPAPTPEDAQRLAAKAEWNGDPEDLARQLLSMHAIGRQAWENLRVLDYTDMLWLPWTLGTGHASVPLALVDEAQDLTPLRQQFLLHLTGVGSALQPGRLIFCGDSDQSIYTWSGADPEALGRLKTATGALEYPLSVSFRCSREVVRYARAHTDFIRPAVRAPAGAVEHVAADGLHYQPGDAVLCRTNAPLVRLALDLMARRFSVSITGRDLAAQLKGGLQDAFPDTYQNDEVTEYVRAWLEPRTAPLMERAQAGDRTASRQLTEWRDLGRCLRYLTWVVSRKTGAGTLADALALLEELCREDRDADVVLSSVHRAKGKEWPRVTLLYPELMPLAGGDPEEERAVQFVAVTRAQQVLRFAYGKDAWAKGERVQPGTLTLEAVPGDIPETKLPETGETGHAQPPVPVNRPTGRVHAGIRPALLQLEDDREHALYGGDTPIPPEFLRERLGALLEEERPLIHAWAQAGLERLRAVEARFVGVHLGTLELYERAARQARLALPALHGTGVPVCVFDAPLCRIRLARKVRVGKRSIRLALGEQELRFHPLTGELLDAASPISPFILPRALLALRAS
ncbi:UvrD-helicase domain-containing protein [Deinococcus aluminii]|uniref:DNA 3'-5' helicase n=1 Tax=Deinococcus aluminii TaxID=1656885 RepID=A0ABP9XF62_9DEIO